MTDQIKKKKTLMLGDSSEQNILYPLLAFAAILLFNLFFIYALSPDEIKGTPEIAGVAAGKAFVNVPG